MEGCSQPLQGRERERKERQIYRDSNCWLFLTFAKKRSEKRDKIIAVNLNHNEKRDKFIETQFCNAHSGCVKENKGKKRT